MSDEKIPASLPPGARVGRAYIDAVVDGIQNLAIIGVASYAWLAAGKIDWATWAMVVGSVAGLMNAGSVLDRLLDRRVPRGVGTIAVAVLGGKAAVGGMGTAAAEVARRTLLVLAVCLLPYGAGCGLLTPDIARTVIDVAREACDVFLAEQPPLGMTLDECAEALVSSQKSAMALKAAE